VPLAQEKTEAHLTQLALEAWEQAETVEPILLPVALPSDLLAAEA